MAGSSIDVPYCTLLDLPCLMKWKRIWYGFTEYPYVEPMDENDVPSINDQCSHCLPTCDGVNFDIVSNVAPLRKTYNASGYFHGLLYVLYKI